VDLQAGEADLAIRYARSAPARLACREIMRDSFWPMCSPALLASTGVPASPAALLRLPLIHMHWQEWEPLAPTWRTWVAAARGTDPSLAEPQEADGLSFREELHAIEAVIGGQGVGICSNTLVAHELQVGALVKGSELSLPGFGFFTTHVTGHLRHTAIETFAAWLARIAAKQQ
jgi:LysR family glycine cleavage system transcriptional activator